MEAAHEVNDQDEIVVNFGIGELKIKLEVFDGDIMKFNKFRSTFNIIAKKFKLDLTEKHLLLQSKLGASVIDQLPEIIGEESYDQVWTNLSKRYDNKRVVIETCLTSLINAEPTDEKDANSLTAKYQIRKIMFHLKRCGATVEDV